MPVRSSTLVILCQSLMAATLAQAAPPAADFYAAPNGKDTWSGRLPAPNADATDGPLATLEGARAAVARLKSRGPLEKPVRVVLRGGAYRIAKPVVFRAEDSGTEKSPITYAAWPGEVPVVSGGMVITGWKKGDGPIWTATVPAVQQGHGYFRQLFVNGRRATPARFPNDDTFRAAGPGLVTKDRTAARKDPASKISLHYQNDDLKPWLNLTTRWWSCITRGPRRGTGSSRSIRFAPGDVHGPQRLAHGLLGEEPTLLRGMRA